MHNLKTTWRALPLRHQLALVTAFCCLITAVLLVGVVARSNQFFQQQLLGEYGDAVAQQLARRLSTELATGDRLAVVAELNRTAELTSISRAIARGIDGSTFADAGHEVPGNLEFSAPIRIDGNLAGEVTIQVDGRQQSDGRQQLTLALAGLAVLLSIAVYGVMQPMGQRLARRLEAMRTTLTSAVQTDLEGANELSALEAHINALPLELLTPHTVDDSRDEHYDDTAVLYVALRSLPGYVDTLDAPRLHRYVALAHRLVYAAAGFYGGQLQVVRQFGLVVYFNGEHKAGSPTLRAASCAWLLQQATAPAENVIRLSLRQGLAIGLSELGPGDGRDIYPGLYIQATLDELQDLAEGDSEALLLNKRAAEDVDLNTRMKVDLREDGSAVINDLADGQRDLLERQLQIMLGAVLPAAESQEPPAGGVSVQH